jgi:hypothetical protein
MRTEVQGDHYTVVQVLAAGRTAAGVTTAVIVLSRGDTAENPVSVRRGEEIRGPAVVTYYRHAGGKVGVAVRRSTLRKTGQKSWREPWRS